MLKNILCGGWHTSDPAWYYHTTWHTFHSMVLSATHSMVLLVEYQYHALRARPRLRPLLWHKLKYHRDHHGVDEDDHHGVDDDDHHDVDVDDHCGVHEDDHCGVHEDNHCGVDDGDHHGVDDYDHCGVDEDDHHGVDDDKVGQQKAAPMMSLESHFTRQGTNGKAWLKRPFPNLILTSHLQMHLSCTQPIGELAEQTEPYIWVDQPQRIFGLKSCLIGE